MKDFKNAFFFWLLLYPGLIVLGWLFLGLLELCGAVRIHNKHLVPKSPRGLLVISNHPSFWEPFVLNYLFIKPATFSPTKFFPYSAPDLKNFDKWYWTTFKDRFVFFPRGDPRGCALAQAQAASLLQRGRIFIIFPEGGRTGTNRCDKWFYSAKGYRLRPLKSGATHLALQTGCDILPVWVKGAERVMPLGSRLPKFWRRIDIRVGPVFKLTGDDKEAGTAKLVESLLALADAD